MKTNTAELAEAIITALIANNVEPHATHIAAPGKDWGRVEAWPIDDADNYAVKYGDNGTTDYDITDDLEDLAAWLITDDVEQDLAATCNARDQEPEEADENHAGPCLIIERRDYFGASGVYSWVKDGDDAPLEFDSIAAAKEWIEESDSETYVTAHNEIGRPVRFIIAV